MLGYLHNLALASGLAAEVDSSAVPAIAGAERLLEDEAAAVSGGARRNRVHADAFTTFEPSVPEARRRLLCDPMTSGGLLVAVAPERAGDIPGALIGSLHEGEPGSITVR